jgi:pimeloyl-ACP methyl ester carboxylesterase
MLRPRRRAAALPAQVLAPSRDVFVLTPWQTEIADWAPGTEIHRPEGGHWLPSHRPELVAELVARLVDRTEGTEKEAA